MLRGEKVEYVRELARRARALAVSEEYEARRRRWRDVNALRPADRPPVWCKPIGCWPELLPEDRLRCEDEFLRGVERTLRRWLIKHDIGDDSLIPLAWPVPAAVELEGEHAWGVEIRHIAPGAAGGAWRHDPPIKSEADLERLIVPAVVHDQAETDRRLRRAAELFDGVMPVRLVCKPPIGLNLAHTAAELIGLDNLLLQLALNPGMVHTLMAFLQTGVLKVLRETEATGLLSENNTGEMYESDSLKTAGPDEPVRVADCWATCNSQELDPVSPAMWEEFELEYERPLLEMHGWTAYGCCENLTRKIDGVMSIANLRIFVCSAWTDLAKVIEAVGDRYTIMWRQKASDVVYGDLDATARHLDEGLRRTRGLHRQVVLRELQTLAGDPQRLHKWTRLAIDAAERHA
jgi:hypothetical protein